MQTDVKDVDFARGTKDITLQYPMIAELSLLIIGDEKKNALTDVKYL